MEEAARSEAEDGQTRPFVEAFEFSNNFKISMDDANSLGQDICSGFTEMKNYDPVSFQCGSNNRVKIQGCPSGYMTTLNYMEAPELVNNGQMVKWTFIATRSDWQYGKANLKCNRNGSGKCTFVRIVRAYDVTLYKERQLTSRDTLTGRSVM